MRTVTYQSGKTLLILILVMLVAAAGCGAKAEVETGAETEAKAEEKDQTIDFSGEWTGTQLLAEISGADAEAYKEMEGLTLDSRLILSLSDDSEGAAELYFVDDLAGPELNAAVVDKSLILTGTLWGDPFEWTGTFEYDEAEAGWTLTGGGDITGTAEDVVFHIVLSLNQASSDEPGSQPAATGDQPAAASESGSQAVSADAPLEELLIGSWMKEPSNVMVERSVLTFEKDGSAMTYYATPGAGDSEETWHTGSWKKDEPIGGTWKTAGNMLTAEFENESSSFETEVRVVDANTIVIEVFYTRSEYVRLP
ncbi:MULTISPECIES: hypothetical protein [Anoxynatronum]|uniref:Lipocalin-like domain-containing protein n=2 Tax=Anoxynatronum TaxID=210622 RepID=A0AA45WV27_9CLOT|nr:hypothetical protein [Anoxynatronum buryatiense]SMP51408.1 hypothetical protein SAMN06296020_10497 [Anoxynatronum buryatiense]